MARTIADFNMVPHSRTLMAGEPLIFHCNFYNYWLQKTLLLDDELEMDVVISNAAQETAYSLLTQAAQDKNLNTREERIALAQDTFSALGFGVADFSDLGAEGGKAVFAMSHYGATLRQACGTDFARPQSLFDAGYSAAAASFISGAPNESLKGSIETCQSMGAKKGLVLVMPCKDRKMHVSKGLATHVDGEVPAPFESNVDEPGILQALSGLDLAGNEEGLIPRFGVMLTNHFANFYNRISFEFVRRMGGSGLLEAGEMLLVDAGYRCAFHTFGGIMTSAEWDAVVKPQLRTKEDWVHGMTAVVNALGWGTWRIAEFSDKRLVMRIWDDYESCGYRDMYGKPDRPVSYLASAGVAGMMNLVFIGDVENKPTLDLDYYAKCFEREDVFTSEQTKSLAMGHDYTEIVATRE